MLAKVEHMLERASSLACVEDIVSTICIPIYEAPTLPIEDVYGVNYLYFSI